MSETNTEAGTASADDANLSRLLDPKAFEAPVEKKPTFGSDREGITAAADELAKQRGTTRSANQSLAR